VFEKSGRGFKLTAGYIENPVVANTCRPDTRKGRKDGTVWLGGVIVRTTVDNGHQNDHQWDGATKKALFQLKHGYSPLLCAKILA